MSLLEEIRTTASRFPDPTELRKHVTAAVIERASHGNTNNSDALLLHKVVEAFQHHPTLLMLVTEVLLDHGRELTSLHAVDSNKQTALALAASLKLMEYLSFCEQFHTLSFQEKRFHHACEYGDLLLAQHLISTFPRLALTLTQELWKTVVRKQKLAMADWLLGIDQSLGTKEVIPFLDLTSSMSGGFLHLTTFIFTHKLPPPVLTAPPSVATALSKETLIRQAFTEGNFPLYRVLVDRYRDILNGDFSPDTLSEYCDIHDYMMFGTETEILDFLALLQTNTHTNKPLLMHLNSRNQYGFTPLQMAALRKQESVKTALLSHGVFPHLTDWHNKKTAEQLAKEVAKDEEDFSLKTVCFLESTATADKSLTAAFQEKEPLRIEHIKRALTLGADPFSYQDPATGDTLLHYAIREESHQLLEQILQSPFLQNVSFFLNLPNNANETPRTLVEKSTNNVFASLLTETEAHYNKVLWKAVEEGNAPSAFYALQVGASIFAINEKGQTLRDIYPTDTLSHALYTQMARYFLLAARHSKQEWLQRLKKHGADVQVADDGGNNALHHVLMKSPTKENILWLLDQGVSIRTINHKGETPTHLAKRHSLTSLFEKKQNELNKKLLAGWNASDVHAVENALKQGGDPNLYFEGKPLLANTKEKAIALLLLRYGAKTCITYPFIGATQEHRDIQLLEAFKEGNIAEILSLEHHGACLTSTPKHETILHLAACHKSLALLKLAYALFTNHSTDLAYSSLLRSNSLQKFLSQQDMEGNTALHRATSYGQKENVLFLLEVGTSPLKWNTEGRVPADCAEQAGHTELARILRDAMEDETIKRNQLDAIRRDGIDRYLRPTTSDQYASELRTLGFRHRVRNEVIAAITAKNSELVQYFLEKGASLHNPSNATDTETLFDIAKTSGTREISNLLLARQQQLNAQLFQVIQDNANKPSACVEYRQIYELVFQGATVRLEDIFIEGRQPLSTFKKNLSKELALPSLEAHDPLALYKAVMAEDMESISTLCKSGAALFTKHSNGITAYALAQRASPLIQSRIEKHYSILKSQLYLALKHRMFYFADQLYSQGIETLDYVDLTSGNTALHDAAERGDMMVATWLITRGASLDKENVHGMTPIQSAQKLGHYPLALLLEKALKEQSRHHNIVCS